VTEAATVDVGLRDASARAAALVRQLTLNEKIDMLHQYSPGVPRLGVAAFRLGQEVLHSASWLADVTVFPQAVGLAASWDPELLETVGAVVAAEVLERHGREPAVTRNVWGPVVNLLRDPRWGRNEEGYSEDPRLTSALAIGFCRGLRHGGADRPGGVLATAPTIKHFLAYNHETDKDSISATGMRPRVLREYDLKPFEAVVRAGVAAGVMLSYNAVNGRPCHVGPHAAALRRWQPHLVLVADAHGTAGMVEQLRYFDDHPQAYAAAMRSGLDSFTNDSEDPRPTVTFLRAAVRAGHLTEAQIDAAVFRLLRMRFELGEFEPQTAPAAVPAPTVRRDLARRAAQRSIVLLKNGPQLLPLDAGALRRVALIGPHAKLNLLDWVSGTPTYRTTVFDELTTRLGGDTVSYAEGVDRVALRCVATGGYVTAGDGVPLTLGLSGDDPAAHFDLFDWGDRTVALRSVTNGRYVTRTDDGSLVDAAAIPGGWRVQEAFRPLPAAGGSLLLRHIASGANVSVVDGRLRAADPADAGARFALIPLRSGPATAATVAGEADVAIVVVGTHPRINGREGSDQSEVELPAGQEAVVRAVVAANPRTAVIIVSGNPVAVPWAADHVPALIWSSHGGQEHGRALADVLLGVHAPAGRLPQTWYRSADDLGDILDYDIIKSERTYLYFRGRPLFPFGHGLTYTTFDYGALRREPDHDELCFSIPVRNTGQADSDEVVQLYVRPPGIAARRPQRQLCGFVRLPIPAGETRTASFVVPREDLAYWDVARHRYVVEPGLHEFLAGRSVADIRATLPVDLAGEQLPARRLGPGLIRAVDFDDYAACRIVDEERGGGEAVEAGGAGSWLGYHGVDLGGGIDRIVAQLAAAHGGTVDVRLDDPVTGPSAAVLGVPAGEADWDWQTVEADVTGAGVRDLFLVFGGPARLAAFAVTRRGG
jgi:beta-glucosidase